VSNANAFPKKKEGRRARRKNAPSSSKLEQSLAPTFRRPTCPSPSNFTTVSHHAARGTHTRSALRTQRFCTRPWAPRCTAGARQVV
jgi:hypothetical protein